MVDARTIDRRDAVAAPTGLRGWVAGFLRPVLPETIGLVVICLIDTVLTVYLVSKGIAKEANPLLSWSFEYGNDAFIVTKVATFMGPLVAIELLRPRVGDFARLMIRVGIIGYLAVYFFGSVLLHPEKFFR